MATPLAATGAYFWDHEALRELLDGLVLFNLVRVNRGGLPPVLAPAGPIREVLEWYGTMVGPLVLAVIASLYFHRPLWRRHAPLLLTLPVFAVWSLLDFQTPEDLYAFLPYAAIGFGALLARYGPGDRAAAQRLARLPLPRGEDRDVLPLRQGRVLVKGQAHSPGRCTNAALRSGA